MSGDLLRLADDLGHIIGPRIVRLMAVRCAMFFCNSSKITIPGKGGVLTEPVISPS